MKKLKDPILFIASLLLLFFSIDCSQPSSSVTSFRNKNIDHHIVSFDTDSDDEYSIDDFQLTHQVVAEITPPDENNGEQSYYFHSSTLSVPYYIRVRNLRI